MISCHSLICGSLYERTFLGHTINMGCIDRGSYQMYIGKSACVWRYSFYVYILFLSDHYFSKLISRLFFMQHRTWFVLLADRAHCWLMLDLLFHQYPKFPFPGLLLGHSSPSLCSCPALHCPRCRICHLLLLNSTEVMFAQRSCLCRSLCKGLSSLKKVSQEGSSKNSVSFAPLDPILKVNHKN